MGLFKNSIRQREKDGTYFCIGRHHSFKGRPPSEGGYGLYKLCHNHPDQRTWRYEKRNLSRAEAEALLEKRLGRDPKLNYKSV